MIVVKWQILCEKKIQQCESVYSLSHDFSKEILFCPTVSTEVLQGGYILGSCGQIHECSHCGGNICRRKNFEDNLFSTSVFLFQATILKRSRAVHTPLFQDR